MNTLKLDGDKLLRGTGKKVKKSSVLLDCIRQIKEVCGPNTQKLKDLKLAKHMMAADRLGQNTIIVPADKLQVFLQAACEANK